MGEGAHHGRTLCRDRQADLAERGKHYLPWGVEQKYVGRNPFAGIKVTVPKKKQFRETRAFHVDEARTILKAASAITDTRTAHGACKRSVHGLCVHWRTPR